MESAGNSAGVTLYKWPEAHGLPSVSPACIQAEAYLRMTQRAFVVSNCGSTTRSPTGQLPTLETAEGFPATDDPQDFGAARACIAAARKGVLDLDASLTPPQRAELLAFTTLVQASLDAATEHSIWMEPTGYQAHVQVAYGGQPFPLNYIMPWHTKREVARKYAGREADAVYGSALAALRALTERLRASSGPYLMGAAPSSLDALVFGHALFYRSSPSAAPVLKSAVTGSPALSRYVDHVLVTYFSTVAPVVSGSSAGSMAGPGGSRDAGSTNHTPDDAEPSGAGGASSSKWSGAAKGEKPPPKAPDLTAVEREFRRRSYWWLGGAATVIVGYFLLSGRYDVQQWVQLFQQAVAADDDDEDDLDDVDDMEDGGD